MFLDVCRVCLAGNATNVINTQLILIFEKVTNNQWKTNQRPSTVCYLCHSLLKKCYKLRKLTKEAEVIFTQLFAGGFEFSEETVPILNQRKLYELSVSPPKAFALGGSSHDQKNEEREELPREVKIELESDNDRLMEEFSTLKTNDEIKKEYDESTEMNRDNMDKDSPHKKNVNSKISPNVYKYQSHVKSSQNKIAKRIGPRSITDKVTDKNKRNSTDSIISHGNPSRNTGKRFSLLFDLTPRKNGVQNGTRRSIFPLQILNKTLSKPAEYTSDYHNKEFSHNSLSERKRKLKPYACRRCSKIFNKRSHMRQHYRSHKKLKPYECNICDKRFTQSSHLQQHRRIHTGETPFSCDLCGKKFKQASHLTQHKLKHTQKPSICELCSMEFERLSKLTHHKIVVHNIKPFECDYCKAGFGKKGFLYTHITRMHMRK